MFDLDDLTEEETIIFLKELEQLKGCDDAQMWAEHAVLRHRELRRGRLKVGRGHVENTLEDHRLRRNAQ